MQLLFNVTLWEIAGLAGAGVYGLVYFLTACDRLPSQSPFFYLFNMLAAGLVIVSLTHSFNLASAVIQIFFVSVSLVGMLRHLGRRRRHRVYARSFHALGSEANSA